MEIKQDYLSLEGNPEFKRLLEPGEFLLYSNGLVKFNKYGWSQKRNIVITNKYIYNLNGLKVRRKISLSKVIATTLSTHIKSQEFIIHVKEEHDYRYTSEK